MRWKAVPRSLNFFLHQLTLYLPSDEIVDYSDEIQHLPVLVIAFPVESELLIAVSFDQALKVLVPSYESYGNSGRTKTLLLFFFF